MKEKTNYEKYCEHKKVNPAELPLVLSGDFYETYGDDAKAVADVLCVKISNCGGYALTGFPKHQLDVCLPKLIRAGNRVAIISESEDIPTPEGEVQRLNDEITRLNREHAKSIRQLYTEILKIGNLPDKLMQLLYREIGRTEVIRIKVDNRITPTLEEARYLLSQLYPEDE